MFFALPKDLEMLQKFLKYSFILISAFVKKQNLLLDSTEFLCICESAYEGERCEILKTNMNCDGKCDLNEELCEHFNETYICTKVSVVSESNVKYSRKSRLKSS